MTRALVLILGIMIAHPAAADAPSKEVCVDAHSKAQDARELGKLALARKLFLSCAQASCPTLVQGDCARFADDLARTQPSVGFVARDGNGVDLSDTAVYVDELLVVTRIDGSLHEIDPGKHSIKFVHAGVEHVVVIVVGAGEKGRSITARFGAATATAGATGLAKAKSGGVKETVVRPKGAKIVMGAGAAVTLGGIALGVYGLVRVPDACSVGPRECAASPGDPVFDDASSAMKLVNLGIIVGGIGIAATVGGLIWHYQGTKTVRERDEQISPWLIPGGGGITVSGHL
jgi:hypothetical protein